MKKEDIEAGCMLNAIEIAEEVYGEAPPRPPSSHRCKALIEVEDLGQLLGGLVRSAPLTVSVTRFQSPEHKLAWLLQLCTGKTTVLLCVRYCPFCGVDLERAP